VRNGALAAAPIQTVEHGIARRLQHIVGDEPALAVEMRRYERTFTLW
jgi:hypothetical protein